MTTTTKLEDHLDLEHSDAIMIRGHRIGIERLIELFHQGYTPEEMAQYFPGLELERVYAAITYYLCHRAELDAYVERIRCQSEAEYQAWSENPSPSIQRLRALRGMQRAA